MKFADKIPDYLKPIVQNTVAALLAAAVAWLVGQGLLAPVQQKLEEQNAELKQQNASLKKTAKLLELSNKEWGIPTVADTE